MAQQLALDLGHVSSRQFEPVEAARMGASRYSSRFGMGKRDISGLENTQADRPRAFAIQQAYRAAQSAPTAPGVKKSYEAMRREVNRQYRFMTGPSASGGMGLHHEVTPEDPYSSPEEMAADVRQGRIRTLSTEATGGHEFFSNRGNDKFRAVHDVFGHAAIGRGFSRHGEEAAYLSHRQMFPAAAQQALASETRGQNAMLNYSPARSFPEQKGKLVGLPHFAEETGSMTQPKRPKATDNTQGRLF